MDLYSLIVIPLIHLGILFIIAFSPKLENPEHLPFTSDPVKKYNRG